MNLEGRKFQTCCVSLCFLRQTHQAMGVSFLYLEKKCLGISVSRAENSEHNPYCVAFRTQDMKELIRHLTTSIGSLKRRLDARTARDIDNTMSNFGTTRAIKSPFGHLEESTGSLFIRLSAARVLTYICSCMVSEKDKPWYYCHATWKRTYDK
jgi:hypothetical protein